MHTRTRLGWMGLIAAGALCMNPGHVEAANYWLYSTDGEFSDASYWSRSTDPTAPTRSAHFHADHADAVYQHGAEFTVTFDQDVTNTYLRAHTGHFTVILDLAGFTYTTTNDSTSGHYIQSPDGVTVVVKNGTADWSRFQAGRLADQTGTLTAINATLQTSAESWVGLNGTGIFNILGKSTLSVDNILNVGRQNNAVGTLRVADSTVNVTGGHLYIGRNATGSLIAEDGAHVTATGTNMIMFAPNAGSTATGLITGNQTHVEGHDITIGGATTPGGTAEVTVADGGHLEARRYIRLWEGGKLAVNGESGGTVRAEEQLLVYDGGLLSLTLPTSAGGDELVSIRSTLQLFEGSRLELLLPDDPTDYALGEFIPLLSRGAVIAEQGHFDDYPEGHTFWLDTYEMEITYVGGSNERVMGLNVIPEPGTIGLLIAATGLLALSRRRGHESAYGVCG